MRMAGGICPLHLIENLWVHDNNPLSGCSVVTLPAERSVHSSKGPAITSCFWMPAFKCHSVLQRCEQRGHNCFLKAFEVSTNLICPPIIVLGTFSKLLRVCLLVILIVYLPLLFYRQPSSILHFSIVKEPTWDFLRRCARLKSPFANADDKHLWRRQRSACSCTFFLWRKNWRQPCGTAAVKNKCLVPHSIHIVFLSTAAPWIWISGAIKGSQIHLDVMRLQSAGIQYHLTLQYPSCSFALHSITLTRFFFFLKRAFE